MNAKTRPSYTSKVFIFSKPQSSVLSVAQPGAGIITEISFQIFNICSRENDMPEHFERAHNGHFVAEAKLSFCSRCGKIDSCNCTANNEELSPREMERRVRDHVRDLGFDRETRRYCWAWLSNVEGVFFSDVFIFSLNFTGEPESRPGTTRMAINVTINVFLPDTDAIRFLFRALKAFNEWSCIH